MPHAAWQGERTSCRAEKEIADKRQGCARECKVNRYNTHTRTLTKHIYTHTHIHPHICSHIGCALWNRKMAAKLTSELYYFFTYFIYTSPSKLPLPTPLPLLSFRQPQLSTPQCVAVAGRAGSVGTCQVAGKTQMF